MGDVKTMTAIRWIDASRAVFGDIPIHSYPGGEPRVSFSSYAEVAVILVRPKSMLDLMAALFFVDALAERGNGPIRLVLPFVPGARQDRLNDGGDYLFTAKSVANEINARRFRSVTIVDPHSEVIAGLIDRCNVVHTFRCIGNARDIVARYAMVISPDAGAEKRAGGVAKWLGVPLVHGWKRRDVETGAIAGFGLEMPAVGGRALVVDDICDGGATFLGLANVIESFSNISGADLFVSHGIFSKGTEELSKRFERIYCTDSIEAERPGVTVIPVCDSLMKGTR